MSDSISDILANSGIFPKKMDLIFNTDFLSRNSVAIPYEDMSKGYQKHLDELAVEMMDPDNSKIIITGSPMSGKTFIIEQFYANKDMYLKRAGQQKLEFVRVPLAHTRIVEAALPGKWQDYLKTSSHVYDADISEIIYVTESVDAAIELTSLGARVILEVGLPTMHHLRQHETSGVVKQWASWRVLNVDDIYLSKGDMIQQLSVSMLDRLNASFPEIHMTRKHIALFVNYSVKFSEILIDEDMCEEFVGRLCVQPGIFAKALSLLASTMAINPAVRDKNGDIVLSKAIAIAYDDFEDKFYACLEAFLEFISEEDDNEIDAMIRETLEEHLPGVQLLSIQNPENKKNKGPKPKQEASEPLKFSNFGNLKERLGALVLGQEEAISKVVEGLKIPASGLNIETRPLRSMLFLGPTGVGKTQLALSLAKELMTTEIPYKRIDMSEYGQEHESSKLLGSPPGYVGHEEGGTLTNFVKENPNSIIILDEIEKAHPKIWDSFLQILDAGRMTDSKGETVDFTKTIVIMTSNIGADKINRQSAGFVSGSDSAQYLQRNASAEKSVTKAVEEMFRPEMINRIDQQVVFHELPQEVLRGVVLREINLAKERISKRGYTLAEPKSDILDYIANMADASKYGAREVQRVVGKNVHELLADTVLSEKEEKELRLSLANGKLVVKSKKIG